jgi:hypothetical protein
VVSGTDFLVIAIQNVQRPPAPAALAPDFELGKPLWRHHAPAFRLHGTCAAKDPNAVRREFTSMIADQRRRDLTKPDAN